MANASMERDQTIVDNRDKLCPTCRELPLFEDFRNYTYELHETFNDFASCSCPFCQWLHACYVRDLKAFSKNVEATLSVGMGGYLNDRGTLCLWLEFLNDDRAVQSVPLSSFADPSQAVSSVVPGRKPACDPLSTQVFSTIERWLECCTNTHPACVHSSDKSLPTYLIDVGTRVGTTSVNLIETSETTIDKYVALSYVWGVQRQPVELTKETRDSMLEYIPEQDLPTLIKDAILVTRGLGVQYLWVDALCIVQNDSLSKKREIANMQHIFGDSFLTIQAACSRSVHESFLKTRATELPAQRVRHSRSMRGLVHLCLDESRYVQGGATSARSWCFEEGVLPNRVITYNRDQVIFKCRTSNRYENSAKPEPYIPDSPSLFGQGPPLSHFPDRRSEALQRWYWILDTCYTPRLLTKAHDRLPAVLGIAQRLQLEIGGFYVAGLWESDLIRGLLWKAQHHPLPRWNSEIKKNQILLKDLLGSTRRTEDRGQVPTWSWASWQGAVAHRTYGKRLADSRTKDRRSPVAVAIHGSTAQRGNDYFKDIEDFELNITAPLREAHAVTREDGKEEWKQARVTLGPYERYLLPINDDHSPFGVGEFDIRKELRNRFWCALLTKGNGLLLELVSTGGPTFRRVGMFRTVDEWMGDWLYKGHRAEFVVI